MIKGMVMPMIYFPPPCWYPSPPCWCRKSPKASAVNNRQRVDAAVSRAFQITLLLCFAVVGGLLIFSDDLGQAVYHSSEVGQMLRLVSLASPLITSRLSSPVCSMAWDCKPPSCATVSVSRWPVVMIWLLLP